MSNKFWDICIAISFLVAMMVSFLAGWYVRQSMIEIQDPERLWEGSAEWVAVEVIENENILLKNYLEDLRVHYDSMVCYRPANTIHK